jgi:sulfite reductase (NADPH) hemoprotein beta-component
MSAALTDVERIKSASRYLRGTLLESLADPVTGGLREDDTQLIKLHGSYQQDDRDLRDERRRQKLEPAYSFMIRTRLPGGVCTPAQWLALDALAGRYANGSLRLTTRQAFQLHGVIKQDLKPTIAAMNAALIDTIAACGDVNRNVMSPSNPEHSPAHAELLQWATRLSEHLLPHSRAYHEIWLDGEKLEGEESEPIYGPTYLPRKFKAAIALPPVNDVDLYSNDLGFIAIVEDGVLVGFNLAVGGGLGTTHGDASTYARLADVVGFHAPEHLLAFAEAVVTTQRDYGDRTNRKQARLKYTIDRMGLDAFVAELQRRTGVDLQPARAVHFEHSGDRHGWVHGVDGHWHLTVHLDSGRIADRPDASQRSGLREIAQIHRGEFRITPNQNLVIANISAADRPRIEALIARHGLDGHARHSPSRLAALACVALPTCPLAMAEAERYLPDFLDRFDAALGRHGLERDTIRVRITGCPNGCARPWLAEVGLIGKAPGRYNLYLGADVAGRRLNRMYRENLDEHAIFNALDPLLARYASERDASEPFGDFLLRAGLLDEGNGASA